MNVKPIEPIEETYSTWHNPLAVPQYIDEYQTDFRRPIRYRWAPGETKNVPSRVDRLIQVVHNGAIIGGQAPQLQKLGSDAKLDKALAIGPLLEEKKAPAVVDEKPAAAPKTKG